MAEGKISEVNVRSVRIRLSSGRAVSALTLAPAFALFALSVGCSKSSAPPGDDHAPSMDDDGDKAAAKKGKKKPADDESPSGSGDKEGVSAANESDVARFQDEKKIDPPKAVKLVWPATNIRAAPNKTSKLVAVVVKGSEVLQLAQRPSGHFLVSFPNPKNGSETLIGWIFKEAVTGSPMTRPLVGGKCPGGYVLDVDRCAKKCDDIGECADGYFCGGQGVQMCIRGE